MAKAPKVGSQEDLMDVDKASGAQAQSSPSDLEELKKKREALLAVKKAKEIQLAELLKKQKEKEKDEGKRRGRKTARSDDGLNPPAPINPQVITPNMRAVSHNISTNRPRPPANEEQFGDPPPKRRGRPRKNSKDDTAPPPAKRQKISRASETEAMLEEANKQIQDLVRQRKRDKRQFKDHQKKLEDYNDLLVGRVDLLQETLNSLLRQCNMTVITPPRIIPPHRLNIPHSGPSTPDHTPPNSPRRPSANDISSHLVAALTNPPKNSYSIQRISQAPIGPPSNKSNSQGTTMEKSLNDNTFMLQGMISHQAKPSIQTYPPTQSQYTQAPQATITNQMNFTHSLGNSNLSTSNKDKETQENQASQTKDDNLETQGKTIQEDSTTETNANNEPKEQTTENNSTQEQTTENNSTQMETKIIDQDSTVNEQVPPTIPTEQNNTTQESTT